MLHMEIIQERLEREFSMGIVTTVPNVKYNVHLSDRTVREVENPSEMPPVGNIDAIYEPYVLAQIITPTEYIGNLMKLCQDRRGIYINTQYLSTDRVDLQYELPLAEIVFDYYDKLKSVSRGYASLDYEILEFRPSNLVKLDVLLNGDPVDALSTIVHREKAYEMGRKLTRKLRQLIPRQMFEVGHPGRYRQQGDCPGNRESHAQGRHGQVLRRRHLRSGNCWKNKKKARNV